MLEDYFHQENVVYGVNDVFVIGAVGLPYYKSKTYLLLASANHYMSAVRFAAGEWTLPAWVLELLCSSAHTTTLML